MNVTSLSLLPQDYGRANYLKREIVAMVRYAKAHASAAKKDALAEFMVEALAFVNEELGTTAAPAV